MKIIRVGVDLAKNVFQIHGVDQTGNVAWRAKLKRKDWIRVLISKVDSDCEIGMEACGGAHHWARQLQEKGYTVRVVAPQFVKPFVKSNKNDANDAEAICEAISRPHMRFVSVKSVAQQDIQSLHRIRSTVMAQRTAKGNQIRGLMLEYGLSAPTQTASLRIAIPRWLEDAENGLSLFFRKLLRGLWEDLLFLDSRIKDLNKEIETLADSNPVAKRLQQMRGVGPMVSTAIIATVGDAAQYVNGRQMAAALGLTPRQSSSGGKTKLLGISKRGDSYLRCLLVHGARSFLITAKGKEDPLSKWALKLAESRNPNIATVAVANKMARIAWAMMRHDADYLPSMAAR